MSESEPTDTTEPIEAEDSDQPDTVYVRTLDAAEIYGITDRSIRKRIRAGTLQGEMINGAWMVKVTRQELDNAGIEISGEPNGGGETDGSVPGPAPVILQRSVPPEPAPVDLTPMSDLIGELARENARLSASAAMWQERAKVFEERAKALEPGPVAPAAVPWWKRLLGIE